MKLNNDEEYKEIGIYKYDIIINIIFIYFVYKNI